MSDITEVTPILRDWANDISYWQCSNCKAELDPVVVNDGIERANYCPHCGAKLNWEDDE